MGFARRLMSQAAPHQAPERAVSLGRVLWEGGVAEKLVVKEKEGFFLARTSFQAACLPCGWVEEARHR